MKVIYVILLRDYDYIIVRKLNSCSYMLSIVFKIVFVFIAEEESEKEESEYLHVMSKTLTYSSC